MQDTISYISNRGSMELRDYQQNGIDRLRDTIRSGKKRPLMVLPTGGGKSHIFGQVISNVLENDKKVLWLVHRRNLVYQMKGILETHFDIHPGIIMAGVDSDTDNPVQLCTIQTYHRRLKIADSPFNRFFINADVLLLDEAHRSVSKTYQDIIENYPDKIIMGCTATAMRADQKGLGEVYDSIVDIVGVKSLTDQGYLSPARYFVPAEIDLDGVKMSMGDYQQAALEKKINKTKLIGDIVENWLKYGEGRPTIVFCVNVKHSISICEAFQKAGVNSEHLDARSSDDERDEAFSAMERGDITVLCNVALYQEGLDVPAVSCIVMARPTKSMGLYRQCIGRGLRVEKGKEDCMVFDHGNVVEEHGFVDEEIEWSLDGKERAWNKKRPEIEKKPVKCRVCNLVFEGANICPDCGSPVKTFGKKVETVDAELKEIDGKRKASTAEKRVFYGMLEYERKMRNYNEGWTSHKYRAKYGVWPKGMKGTGTIQPNAEFFNWITYQNIKWAKRNGKEKKAA